jgi:hypothetical protein
MIKINQVIRRGDQGVSRPYICRDEEGRQLWVKGSAWLAGDLVSEWICAQLALEFGLPIAECDLVMVADELIEHSAISDIASLGAGIGFGSIHASGATELDYGDVEKVNTVLQADVLLFDYWIQNDDRGLGENGGNPNMLWKMPEEQLVLIDHNAAFDNEFSNTVFFENHAFGAVRCLWDEEYCADRQKKLLVILEELPDKLTALPEEWFVDDEIRKSPLREELIRIEDVLRRIEKDPITFWEVNP